MIDVKEVLRRWAADQSNRQIARETGTDRGTTTRYIAVASLGAAAINSVTAVGAP